MKFGETDLNFGDLTDTLRALFGPNASLDFDENDQIVVYTNLRVNDTHHLERIIP